MAGFSKAVQDDILNWFKGTAFPTAPTGNYLALFTTNPTADDGTGAVEVSGGSYARQAITWGAIGNGSGTTRQIQNSGALTFPSATANWGSIIGIGIYDAATVGNLLAWGTITSVTINSGNQLQFNASAVTLNDD